MQDLASEFSKIFRRRYPRTLIAGGATPSRTQQPGLWPGAGRKRPGVGIQTLVPLNFSAVVAPPLLNVLTLFIFRLVMTSSAWEMYSSCAECPSLYYRQSVLMTAA